MPLAQFQQNPFVKVQKTRAYFKRFQTKYRRRREGKTDYKQRKKLVAQNKTKYNVPKYRLVVRISKNTVTCQIIYSKLVGDQVLCSAYSSELPRFGVKVGLTNYAACYCTGLLLARRLLKQIGLDSLYAGVGQADGNYYIVRRAEDERRPFRANLDIGLARASTGARVFGALKGAVDGGLYVPHSARRFPGYNDENDEYDPEAHRQRIYGLHVANYMKELSEGEDPTSYQRQFSRWIKNGVNPDSVEAMYRKAHEAIRKNPERVTKEKKEYTKPINNYKQKKLPLAVRKHRAQIKKQNLLRKAGE